MRALLEDLAVLDDDDAVRVAHGGEPVGDDEDGAPLHQRVHAALDMLLGARVDGARGLVEDHDRRIGDRSAGDGEQLALALGEVRAVAGDDRIVAVRQVADEAVRVRALRRGDALLVGCVEAAVADVVHDRSGEEVGVLQNGAERAAQGVLADVAHVDPVVGDDAVLDLIKAVDEVRDRRLAGAGGADEGDLLPGLRVDADVLQHRFVRHVAEVYVHEPHVAAQRDERAVRLLPRPCPARAVPAVHGGQRDLALVDLGLRVHDLEDALRAGERREDRGELLADLVDRTSDLAGVDQIGGEAAEVEPHDEGEEAAEGRREGVADVHDVRAHRHDRAGEEVRVRRRGAIGLVELLELLFRDLLVRERLDDLEPLDDLLDVAVHLAERCLLLAVMAAGAPAEDLEDVERRRKDDRRHDKERGTGVEHRNDETDEVQDAGDQVDEALLHRERDVVGVVREAAHQLAVRVAVEVGERQRLQRVEEVAAQAVGGVLREAHHRVGLEVGRGRADDIQGEEQDAVAQKRRDLVRERGGVDEAVDDRPEHVGAVDGGERLHDQAQRDEQQGELFLRHVTEQAEGALFRVLRLLVAAAGAWPALAWAALRLCGAVFHSLCRFAHPWITPSCWEL